MQKSVAEQQEQAQPQRLATRLEMTSFAADAATKPAFPFALNFPYTLVFLRLLFSETLHTVQHLICFNPSCLAELTRQAAPRRATPLVPVCLTYP